MSRKTGPDAADVSSYKVAKADQNVPNTVDDKVEQVAEYIRIQLAGSRSVRKLNAMKCPSPAAWDEAATGYTPELPSATILSLYANARLKASAKKLGGDLRNAYFEVARERVRKQLKAKEKEAKAREAS